MSPILRRAAFAGMILSALATVPVCAQTGASAPAQTAPQAKLYGDWGVRCYSPGSASPCEMQELVTQNKTGQRVMSTSIAYAPAQNRYIFQLAVPLGVSLAKGARIVADGYNGAPMAFRRCDRGGCYVEGLIDTKALDALQAATGPAKIQIASPNGRSLELPFSLRGFADARKAMTDMARDKASASGDK
ncbi:MAG TPA: invasion associated locus B family protein [Rhizomicrobium sp.]|nr:invasion associated locus B family protein [Rhizomicrobium sp.]